MSGWQKFMFIGNLTRDAEVTMGERPRVNFDVAVNGYKDSVLFVSCTGWGKLAENVGPNLHKGDKVMVEGEVEEHRWTDGEGNDRSRWQVTARGVQYLTPKAQAGTNGNGANNTAVKDDIPF